MRRLTFVLVVPALLLAACGSKPDDAATGAGPSSSTTVTTKAPAAGAPKTTATTAPKVTVTTAKKQADCTAYQAFSFAYSGLVMSGTKATFETRLENYSKVVDDLKKAAPSLAKQLDDLAGPLRRTLDKTGSAADKDQATKLLADLRSWYEKTCL